LSVGPGFGVFMVKVCSLDVPPPGVGLTTVTEAVPAVAMSAAAICAVSWVLLPNVVDRAVPFHWTTAEATKFVPVTVSVKAGSPPVALGGGMELNGGAGVVVMVNVCALEGPPPGVGLNTVTGAVPAVAMSPARICAVSCVLL